MAMLSFASQNNVVFRQSHERRAFLGHSVSASISNPAIGEYVVFAVRVSVKKVELVTVDGRNYVT